MVFCGTHIVVTLELISNVLRVLRVDHSDYPSHQHLSSISRDEIASLFCEKTMLWGGTLNFSTIEFTKGPRILNMVMTFVLTSWSHYNTITHDNIYYRLLSRHTKPDKLIFPSTITRILTHMHITIPPSPLFHVMGAISKESIQRSATQLATERPCVETTDAAPSPRTSSTSALSFSFRVDVSLADIMD